MNKYYTTATVTVTVEMLVEANDKDHAVALMKSWADFGGAPVGETLRSETKLEHLYVGEYEKNDTQK